MNTRVYKIILALAAVLLLAGAGQFQKVLNRERITLGFTPLPNDPAMPPMLALTTQALGGFRGLMANFLYIRANDLQLEDKYFEMVQLSRWITLLEPKFVQVWVVQAWNMAYNISVKFTNAGDRWRWVRHGIELLRDEALRYNPDEPLIYRELAWFYQHKMGANLDDAHFFYKAAWAREMTDVLTTRTNMLKFTGQPNYDELLNPATEEAAARARKLREQYKIDPKKMKEIDARYGPFDWRLPEAHSVYWAFVGMEKCSKQQDLMALRRPIYQSMQLSFQRGRLKIGPQGQIYLGPNLEIIANASAAYEEMAREESNSALKESIGKAHRNFLKEAVYELYIHNRLSEGERWYKILREKYPAAVPAGMTLTEYAVLRAIGDVEERAQARMTSIIQAFVTQSYLRLIEGETDESIAFMQRAREMSEGFDRKNAGNQRLAIPPLAELKKQVLDMLLDPSTGLSAEARARLRTELGLPAEGASPKPEGK